jgi:signal transduction histidine kinase
MAPPLTGEAIMNSADKVNILLVDDQPAKLLGYEAILSPLGENLVRANSGREALEHLLRTDIAVVLVDVCMPDLDGFELAAMIREHPRHRRAAIIFVSAVHMTDIDRLRGYECGGVDYVSVPVEPELLRARVSVFADLYRKTRALERLNQELERRVEERTAELRDTLLRLQESEASLRDADHRKDEFLAMLAHELRNPLAPIRNSVEILRQRADQERGLRWSYEVIERQLAQLSRLVDDLLDVSRITRGRLEIRPEIVDLGEILRNAADGIRPEVCAKHLQFEVAVPAEPVPVQADPVRLTQVVLNLLDNARKFTPDGGTVGLAGEQGSHEVVITVRDSGPGIPAEARPRLFQMFYQVNDGTAPYRGGLGIGLALVKRIVEMHGGTVEVRSPAAGNGSEFVVRLPLVSAAPVVASSPLGRSVGLASPRRVLVVDDNEDSANSLAVLLRRDGNTVRTAYDGLAAIAAAESFHAEVVLLDIGLPALDGYHVARQIRQTPWGRDIVLVAVTGWGQENDRRRTREAGFDAHLVKPVDFGLVRGLLGRAPAPERLSQPVVGP